MKYLLMCLNNIIKRQKKVFKIMRLSFIILSICLFQLSASVYSQNGRFTIEIKNTTMRELFKEIEQQSQFRFFYNDLLINIDQEVSIDVKDKRINEILDMVLANSGITYRILDNQLIVVSPAALLQQLTVTGSVTDNTGDPIPGVNVVVKGTLIGVVTNPDGKYSISVPDANTVLQFSFVGYTTKEIQVGSQRTIDVVLTEDAMALEEVVVVGYGVQKKVNMTGAVVSVDVAKMIDNRPITNLSSGLSGLAPGVFVNQGSGKPGYDQATIRIRGQGSLNNSDPLIVIDGVLGDMNDLNPQDVASISVLKDAASSAIYGSRAANGVILITTNRGREGTARITYNGFVTAQSLSNRLNMVTNYADYMELVNEGNRNTNMPDRFTQDRIDEWRKAGNSDPIKYPNTDWQDEVFGRGLMQNHTLSVSGGTEKLRYFVSGNYLKNPGVMENTSYDRMTVRTNLDADIKSWFTVGVNAYGYKGVADLGLDDNEIWANVQGCTPGMLFRHPDGRYGGTNNDQDNTSVAGNNNILAAMNSIKGDRTTNKLVSRLFAQIRPLQGLSIEGSFTYDFQNRFRYQQPVFFPRWNFYNNTIQSNPGDQIPMVINENQTWYRQNMDGIIRYETNVDRLNIQAMAGSSQESYKYQWFRASKKELTSPEFTVLDAATADAAANGNYQNWAMRSYFGRFNLNWAEKYLLEANLRMDYSSRFAPGATRRGVFPSFSAGWRISEEDFMRNVSWLNALKLRVSYGALGNNISGTTRDDGGNYDHSPLYYARNYVLNGDIATGFAQTRLANPLLTWETAYISNLGIDFGLLKSRLNGSVDFFVKNTKDILIDLPAPLVHGTSGVPKKNIAEVSNKGVELSLSWTDKIGEFRYFIDGNISFTKNEVTKLKGDERIWNRPHLIQKGYPINQQCVMPVDRILQTDEDMAYLQSMLDVNPRMYLNFFGRNPVKGDFLYIDSNEDGFINQDDYQKYGNGTNPTTVYGLIFGVGWKGFDFSCLMQGISGLYVFWGGWDASRFLPTTRWGYGLNKTITDGRWYEGCTDAKYPRLMDQADWFNYEPNNRWMQHKDYLKVKNIQLSYTVPKTISQKILLDVLRFYVSIDNALTFTKYQGIDPEIEGTNYPTLRMTSFGVNLTF